MIARNLLILLIFGTPLQTLKAQKRFPPEKPKLVIGIVVEGMRYDYIQRYWEKFGENGFKKMISQGTFCSNTNHNTLFNDRSTGYANIATGAWPSGHGIVADNWYNRLGAETVYSIADASVKGFDSQSIYVKNSARKLQASNLADELLLTSNFKSLVYSVALNPEGAILSAGHFAQAAFWLDPESGNWTSNNYYLDSIPHWVNSFNEKKLAELYLERDWNTLHPISQYTESLEDNTPYESGLSRRHGSFPYNLNKIKSSDFQLLTKIPYGNTYTKDFAIAALANTELGKDKNPDLFYIGFSVTGNQLEHFSPTSVETQETYLRLDLDLAHFLDFIEAEYGRENVLIYLTADRGAPHSPEYLSELGMDVDFFYPEKAIGILNTYLNAVYGRGKWVQQYSHQQIYLNRTLIEDARIPLNDFQNKVAQFMIQIAGITHAMPSTAFDSNHFAKGNFSYMQNSYHQERSGDVFISLTAGWVEKTNNRELGLSTNSIYRYDRHVPLIWYGWKIGRNKINRSIETIDIAPTLADFLWISYPNSASGQPIDGLIK